MNENESLSLDWSKATTFPFFKLAFKVVGHKTAKQTLGKLGTKGVIGKEYEKFWVVAMFNVGTQNVSKKDKKKKSKAGKTYGNVNLMAVQ